MGLFDLVDSLDSLTKSHEERMNDLREVVGSGRMAFDTFLVADISIIFVQPFYKN